MSSVACFCARNWPRRAVPSPPAGGQRATSCDCKSLTLISQAIERTVRPTAKKKRQQMYRLTRVPAWSQYVEYVSMDFVHVLLPLSAKGRPSAQETTPSNGAGNNPKNLSLSLSLSLARSLARSTITDRAGCTHVHQDTRAC